MGNEFEIYGHFYEISDLKCRKYLDIKRVESDLEQPDIMVVMMNPGSSYPLDGIDNNRKPSIACPDRTQNQIMAVMGNNFNFARVLNLSDFRQPNSKEFYKFLKSDLGKSIPHSIFHPSRDKDFSNLFYPGVPVIYGWGVDPNLQGLAREAINRISEKNPIGIRKGETEWAYYHPLPRIRDKQIEWVTKVSLLLLKCIGSRLAELLC